MQQREIKLEQIEQTIRKVLARGGEFSFYPGGTSMQPFIVQGRDKVTLAALPDRIKKYDIILYKRENGTFVLHRVTGKKENAYIFRGDNQFSDEYGIKRQKAYWYIPCAFQRYAVKRCCMAHDYAAGGYLTKRRKPGKPGNALRERDIPPSSG